MLIFNKNKNKINKWLIVKHSRWDKVINKVIVKASNSLLIQKLVLISFYDIIKWIIIIF